MPPKRDETHNHINRILNHILTKTCPPEGMETIMVVPEYGTSCNDHAVLITVTPKKDNK